MKQKEVVIAVLAILSLLVLAFVIWYLGAHPEVQPADTGENTASSTASVESTPAHVSDEGEYYKINVTYPTDISFPLSSRSDSGAEADRIIKEWVDKNVKEFKAYAAENESAVQDFVDRGEEIPESFKNMFLTVSYERKASSRTVTYLFNSASYTGGAHGIEVPVTFTFNIASGEHVELADLFLPDSAYLTTLSQLARADLPTIIGEYANPDFITDGTEPTDDNFSTFYLENGRIVFLFAPYQVGPYVLGTVTYPVELNRLSDILKPEYR